MSLFGLLFDLAKPFMIGLVVFAVPPLLAVALPDDRAKAVWRQYESMALNILDRGVLTLPSFKLRRTSRDHSEANEEIGGATTESYNDDANLMHRWHGRPFGLVDERVASVTDIRTMDVASEFRRRQELGLASVSTSEADLLAAHVPVPREPRLVDPDGTLAAVGGSAPPGANDHVMTLVEKAHSLYDSTDLVDIMIWLTAFGVGLGSMWIASQVVERSSSGSTVIPMDLTPVVLLL